MPIRTPHGRAAAYRGIWQWPLRSPGRLAATLVVLVVLVAGVSFGIARLRGPERAGPLAQPGQPTTTATPYAQTPSTPVQTALPRVSALTPTELPAAAASPAAVDVALRWTRAWLRPATGVTAQQWLDKLRPLTTAEYLGVLSTVDPSNNPSTRLTGQARAVSAAPSSVKVRVPTDAKTLIVVVIDDAGTWRVADYDEA